MGTSEWGSTISQGRCLFPFQHLVSFVSTARAPFFISSVNYDKEHEASLGRHPKMGSSYTNYEYHNLECQAGCDLTYFAQQMASTLAVFPKYQCLGPPSSPPSHNLCAASLVTEILHHHRGVQTGLMNMTPLLQSFCERPGGRCFKLTLKLDTSSCVVYCDSSTLPLRK